MFKPKSVDSILSAFSKTVDELRALEQSKLAEAEKTDAEITALREKIAALREKREAADVEAMRASAVARKLESLIS